MKNLKLTLILLATLTSLQSFASLDCDDVKSMSTASTLLSRDIYGWEQRKGQSESDSEVLPLAQRIVDELVTSIAINAEENSDYVNSIVERLDNPQNEPALIRAFRQGALQQVNSLRVQHMSRIRQLYAQCLR